jgi:serine/threonine protein kinase/Tfp pilus assembly protein PilF
VYDPEHGPSQGDLADLTRLDDSTVTAPERIGPYRILQKLGEGGMGVVYEAEQEHPVRRKVALKVIKLGMDTEQVVRRFESERQALALMDHPNIARVYDAGATAHGRPYFAMECVKGVPITEYCEHNRLPTRDRLELFVEVCHGVHHAHQKGIIHRDIKPSNVLVRDEDDRHVPKIIDFGIAKATAKRLTDHTVFTELGQLVGTPEYMSPEQAEMSGIDVDIRTDVYLLGILLYELLTGELPFAEGDRHTMNLNEYRRRVLETEALRPSTRVSTASETVCRAAREQGAEPRALARLLRGDLDWITMKALERDRTRRYASASEFAQDVERYLKDEPVLAGPPSNLYRLGKFARRHRAGVAFGVVVLVLLTGFAATMTVTARMLFVASDQARHEAHVAREVSRFLEELFEFSDPEETRGQTLTAREILDRGAERIAGKLDAAPDVRARLMYTIGTVYGSLGLSAEARGLLEGALEIQRELPEGDGEYLAETMTSLADLLVVHGGEYGRAEQLYRDALEIRRARSKEDDSAIATTLNRLGIVLSQAGKHERAAEYFAEAFAIWERTGDEDSLEVTTMLSNRAILLRQAGDSAGARPLLERALAIRERLLDPEDALIARSLEHLATVLVALGEHAAARSNLERALAIYEKIYAAAPHERTAHTLLSLAKLSVRQGRLGEAEALEQRAYRMWEQTGSLDAKNVLYDRASYAAVRGQRDQALGHLRRAVAQGFADVAELSQDADFRSLAEDESFRAILAALGRGSSAG